MNAPTIWIIFPGVIGIVYLLLNRQRTLAIAGGSTAMFLALLALILPIDQALEFGTLSLKISPAIQILGRRLIIIPADGSLLAAKEKAVFLPGLICVISTKKVRRINPLCCLKRTPKSTTGSWRTIIFPG